MHQHKCSRCATMWEHGEEWDNSIPAHECPQCGAHQFRLHKLRGPTEARFDWPKLLLALEDPTPFARSTAIFAIEAATAEAHLVVPKLAQLALQDSEPMVRLAAVEALWRFGPKAIEALSAIAAALQDKRAEVRRAAALTLAEFGPAAIDSLPHLTDASLDRDPRVREAVANALTKIRSGNGLANGTGSIILSWSP
jgi:predicted  nucleic acid-binding Zn-ribbon protein